jgi:outer membrane protein OmpA-like peptidoglycan-associated protein
MSRLCALILVIAAPGFADSADSDDVKDPPGLPRYPGYVISGGVSRESGSQDFNDGQGGTTTRDGAEWELNYSIKDGARVPATADLFKFFETAFKKKGGSVVFKKLDAAGAEGVLKMPIRGKAERWLHLTINNDAQQMIVHVIDDKGYAPRAEFTAAEMAHALERDGRVALHGFVFVPGKDTLEPGSDPVLAELSQLFLSDDNLNLIIEGHTDNVGNAKVNLALSKKRADAVKRTLVSRGIEASRLKSAGYGDAQPITTNDTDEGKAQNRRVELVKF